MIAATSEVTTNVSPDKWRRLDLSQLVFIKGKAPRRLSDNADDGHIPYLTPDYLRDRTHKVFYCSAKRAVGVGKDEPIVLWDGSNAGEVFLSKEGALASTMCKVTTPPSLLPRHLFYFLKSKEYEIKSRVKGSGIPHVDKYIFSELNSVFPVSNDEQRTIVAILTVVDDLIALTERVVMKLRRIKQGLMQDLLTRGIDGKGNIRSEKMHKFKDSPLGRIPAEWEAVRIGEIAEVVNGTTPSIARKDYWNEGTVPWLPSGKVNEYRIRTATEFVTERALRECSLRLLPKGTVIVAMIGQGRTRGMSARLEIETTINQNLAAIVPTSAINGLFLHYYLDHHYADIRAGGRGSNQDALTCGLITRYVVALPSKVEQERIANSLFAIEQQLDGETALAIKLRLMEVGLMDDLLTGRVRVSDSFNP